jgi:hypothetical protein
MVELLKVHWNSNTELIPDDTMTFNWAVSNGGCGIDFLDQEKLFGEYLAAAVFQPSTLRGRLFSVSATASTDA